MHRCWPGLFPEVYFRTTWWITSPPLLFRLGYKKMKVWCHHSEMIAIIQLELYYSYWGQLRACFTQKYGFEQKSSWNWEGRGIFTSTMGFCIKHLWGLHHAWVIKEWPDTVTWKISHIFRFENSLLLLFPNSHRFGTVSTLSLLIYHVWIRKGSTSRLRETALVPPSAAHWQPPLRDMVLTAASCSAGVHWCSPGQN